ncbi:MAG TPA: serine/threonine-protein kinase [Solirubrobacteraceae bacterium]
MHHAHTLPALVLDRYRLVRRLGSGGFGTVWLAHDERLDRSVAVKRVATADAEQAERARREALAAARLSHPGIVALYEAGADETACYLVSELVRGETLGVLEAEGALSDLDVAEIGVALADALAHAHARGVVHRDVKPGNVIVPEAPEEGGSAAKLTDFGIARVVGDDAMTRTGDVLGTLAYMAPEHAAGRGATPSSDLYALGLVLYEALAGVNPVRGASPAETARRIGERVPPLGRFRRDLPRELCAAINAAVAVDPRQRGSVGDLGDALAAAAPELSDEPGIVVEPERTGLTLRVLRGREAPPPPAPERAWPASDGWADADELVGRRPPRARRDADALTPDGAWAGAEPAAELRAARPGTRLAARLAAGAGAGGLVAAALAGLAPEAPPVAPAAAAATVAGAVALLPGLAWLAAAAALVVWLAAAGRPGTALVLAPALALVPVLLPRGRTAWSLPAAAPVLGLAGLAGGYCALAGQATTAPRRAGLGALGALWLVVAEALLDRRLLGGAPDGLPDAETWQRHIRPAVDDVLPALLDARTLALAGAFAVAAVLLPWLVRGRRLAPDAVAATAWTAGLAAATQAAIAPNEPRGLVAGAIVAGALALVLRAARRPVGA